MLAKNLVVPLSFLCVNPLDPCKKLLIKNAYSL